MSTNDKTPDPAPALLSTARLAEIRERVSYTVIAEAHNEAIADRAALLAHLDALTPRAVVDGEALGRVVWEERRITFSILNPGIPLSAIQSWEGLLKDAKDERTERAKVDECIRIGLALHAAGRSEGEAERASLHRQIEGLHRIADEEQGLRVDRDATIARLTAALRTETTMKEQVQDQLVEMRGKHREEWERAERLTTELAEARATLDARMGHLDNALATITTASAAARIEGARVERERLIAHYEGLGRTGIVSELRKLDLGARGAGGAG